MHCRLAVCTYEYLLCFCACVYANVSVCVHGMGVQNQAMAFEVQLRYVYF